MFYNIYKLAMEKYIQKKQGEDNVTGTPLVTLDSFANECLRWVNQ